MNNLIQSIVNLAQNRRKQVFGLFIVLLAALVVFTTFLLPNRQDQAGTRPVFSAKRGPLTISVAQSGTIQAQEQKIILCEVEGRNTLIYIIEEGAIVEEGDIIAEIDASKLQDSRIEQEIRVQNAEASFIRAREQLEVVKSQAESNIAQAELNHQFAAEDLTKYREGEYRQELLQSDSAITLAEQELQLAARKLEWSQKLYDEEYISMSERDADQLAYNRAIQNLELARSSRKLLEEYTYKRKLAQLSSDVEQTARSLERERLKANADTIQAEADLKAKEAEYKRQKSILEKINDQIVKTVIRAPQPGLVVYATSMQMGRRGNQEPLEAGQEIRERQELIYLPRPARMKAEIQLHETHLDKVEIGQSVRITIDSLPDRVYRGRISRMAPLPDAVSIWMNPDLKVYRTEVVIEGEHPELRTGTSCLAEIMVAQIEDAVYVPIQSVVRKDGKPVVYLERGRSIEAVAVETGLDNNRMIHIVSGLSEGDQVLVAPPLDEAEAPQFRKLEVEEPAAREPIIAAPPAAATAIQPEQAGQARSNTENMSEEQREAMRKRMESMTPEQREAMRARFRQRSEP